MSFFGGFSLPSSTATTDGDTTENTLRQNPNSGAIERRVGDAWVPLSEDIWVDEAGDTMTGDLDMSGHEIDNARLDAGSF